jgi:hypothetical protein
MVVELRVQRAVRARPNAIAAANAALAKIENLRLARLALGVVAPAAAQRTTLEKNRGSNSRAIVKRETHDVEDEACRSRPGR